MNIRLAALALALLAGSPSAALATEEAEYRVMHRDGPFELREYAPAVVAETVVEGDLESAGNAAFRKLFRDIDGNNQSRQEIAMTAPVSQRPVGEKIAMTAPVAQQAAEGGWAVSFMMPSAYSMETLPQPLDPAVTLREVPAHRAAVVRYSGFWSQSAYDEHLKELRAWMQAQGVVAADSPVWARYDPPFKPWFLRRNEILIPVR